ncbi:hypothetical protein Tco_0846414 [Tanacetum coccineum]
MNLASIDATKKVLIVVVELLGAQTVAANWIFLRIAHIWTRRSSRTIVADDLVLMVVVKLAARTCHLRSEQEMEIFINRLQEYIAMEVELQRPTDLTSAMYYARLYERRRSENQLEQQSVQ